MALNYTVYQYDGSRNAVVMTDMEGKQLISLMNSVDKIFKDRLIENYLSKFSRDNISNFEEKFRIMKRWYNASAEKHLDRTKETAIQGTFMMQVFENVLGYTTITGSDSDIYNQKQEFKSILDTSEADGGLGFFSKSASNQMLGL